MPRAAGATRSRGGPRFVEGTRPPSRVRRRLAAIVTTSAGLFLSRHVSWKLDPLLLRLTRGRVATSMMFPVAVLETTGARSGARRRNAVIYWNDGDDVVIAASHAGRPTHPGWYFNVVADPHVVFGGTAMRAEVVPAAAAAAADRARLWALGDNVFPPFATYREQAASAGRTIPLVRLTRAARPATARGAGR
jgi:deazaflavin-dependent oxidoreductase (nitroreductase family)